MDPNELRKTLLGALLKRDHSRDGVIPSAVDLAGEFGVNVDQIVDQLDILESEGAVRLTRTYGGNVTARITGIGKRAYESMSDLSNAAQGRTPAAFHLASRVFVVHGRNQSLRESMFSFLRAIGLKPIEWNEAIAATKKPSPYIGEILDAAFTEAQAIVVLASGDDEARLTPDLVKKADPPYEKQLTPQPRPNVLFEAGLAIGRDQNRTVIVQVGTLRPWSDIAGKHITHLDNSYDKRNELANKLRIAGCQIDLTGDDWVRAGDFGILPMESVVPASDETSNEKAKNESGQGNYYFSGTGPVTAKPFTMETAPWVLRYSANWTGHFAVELRGASHELVVNTQVIASKVYETYIHNRKGELHFAVVAAPPDGEWTLEAVGAQR